MKIPIALFNMSIHVYFGKTGALRYLKASKKLKYKSHASGLGEVSGFLIWFRDTNNTPVFVHEISHLVDNIIDYYSLNGEEIRAFLSEYLYKEIIKRG